MLLDSNHLFFSISFTLVKFLYQMKFNNSILSLLFFCAAYRSVMHAAVNVISFQFKPCRMLQLDFNYRMYLHVASSFFLFFFLRLEIQFRSSSTSFSQLLYRVFLLKSPLKSNLFLFLRMASSSILNLKMFEIEFLRLQLPRSYNVAFIGNVFV